VWLALSSWLLLCLSVVGFPCCCCSNNPVLVLVIGIQMLLLLLLLSVVGDDIGDDECTGRGEACCSSPMRVIHGRLEDKK